MEPSATARVLVVDDEVRALRLMSRVLANSGIPCCTAESAAEALQVLRQAPEIDVVVSDICMPTTDGIEFLGTIRRDFADRPWIQLLLVTGQASLETAIAAMRLEASDYLFKPIEPKLLRESVQHVLTRAESIRQVRGDAPGAASQPARPEEASLRTLQLLQKLQEARSSIFGGAVMPEPAWEMVAELMRARLAGQHLSVTSLALSSKSPMTTALRRIDDLIQGGLAARVPDPADRRRTYVELTAEGMARMQLFLEGFARTALVSH